MDDDQLQAASAAAAITKFVIQLQVHFQFLATIQLYYYILHEKSELPGIMSESSSSSRFFFLVEDPACNVVESVISCCCCCYCKDHQLLQSVHSGSHFLNRSLYQKLMNSHNICT